jgi:hypothetical protein
MIESPTGAPSTVAPGRLTCGIPAILKPTPGDDLHPHEAGESRVAAVLDLGGVRRSSIVTLATTSYDRIYDSHKVYYGIFITIMRSDI